MAILSIHDRIWKNKINRTILLSVGLAVFCVFLGFLLILWPRPTEEPITAWYLTQIRLGELTVIDLAGIICLGVFFMFMTIGIAAIREALRQDPGFPDILVIGLITLAMGALLLSGWGAILTLVLILIFSLYLVFSKIPE
jgi:hypothetical protein